MTLKDIKMAGSNLPVSLWVDSLPVDDRQIATEAVFKCFNEGVTINRMELGSAIRELKRKQKVHG